MGLDVFRSLAEELIEALSAHTATITNAGTSYNEDTDEDTPSGTTNYTVPCTPRFDYEVRLLDGKTIQVGDKYVLVAAAAIGDKPLPKKDWTLVFDGGITNNIQSVMQYEDDQVAAYQIQLRGKS